MPLRVCIVSWSLNLGGMHAQKADRVRARMKFPIKPSGTRASDARQGISIGIPGRKRSEKAEAAELREERQKERAEKA